MFKLLIDTSAWLHLAENPQQETLLQVLERLTERGEASLIVPRVVISEIAKNKDRIVQSSGRRLSTHLKQVKEALRKHGNKRTRKKILSELDDIDNRIPNLGELVNESIGRIEKLLKAAPVIETTDAVKLRAAQRAIDKRAPFHHDKNSINDCLFEVDPVFRTTGPGFLDGGQQGVRRVLRKASQGVRLARPW